VFIRIGSVLHYLWRAVDQDGAVLDILIQSRRDAGAAKRFFKRLPKGLRCVPRVLITDKLRSYGVAKRELLPGVEHRTSRYLNNRAENSHRPTRRRERQMQRFKSSSQAQRFLSAHAFIYRRFHPRRHRMADNRYLTSRAMAFKVWQQETCAKAVAQSHRGSSFSVQTRRLSVKLTIPLAQPGTQGGALWQDRRQLPRPIQHNGVAGSGEHPHPTSGMANIKCVQREVGRLGEARAARILSRSRRCVAVAWPDLARAAQA
jgi:hypothetical protein